MAGARRRHDGAGGQNFDIFGQNFYFKPMQSPTTKRPNGSLRILCEAAPAYGVTAEQCLDGTGLVAFDLYDPDSKVTLAQELQAISNFLNHAPKRVGLGIEIGQRYQPQVFGIWGYAILSSPTFRAGLKVAIDFANLSFIIATVGLDEDQSPPLLTFDTAGLPEHLKGFILERHLTVLTNFRQQLLPDVPLSHFTFVTTLSDPAVAEAISAQLGMRVVLGQSQNGVILHKRLLDLPLPRHDPEIMQRCLAQCRDLMPSEDQERQTETFRDKVLMAVEMDSTIGAVATKLGLTERTFRRRLADEGTSFRQILAEARLAVGHELLATAGLDVSTAAWRSGYSEPSSFVRAFSRQYGYSPGTVKQRAKTQAAQIHHLADD